jgi:hypothetical protein
MCAAAAARARTTPAAAAVAATATAMSAASSCNSYEARLGLFVEDMEGRQTDVCDFLFAKKDSPRAVLQ